MYAIGGTFFEPYPEKIEQPMVPDNYSARRDVGGMVLPITDRYPKVAPLGAYKWSQTLSAPDGLSKFEPDLYDGYVVEYINPSNRKTANPNIAAWMQKLPRGFHGKLSVIKALPSIRCPKGPAILLFTVSVLIGQKEITFVIPNWAWL